jgi:hypothetical protein
MKEYSPQRHRAVTPHPKSKQIFHHEAREEHEVRKLKCNNFRILRVLRALRGDLAFAYLLSNLEWRAKFAHASQEGWKTQTNKGGLYGRS